MVICQKQQLSVHSQQIGHAIMHVFRTCILLIFESRSLSVRGCKFAVPKNTKQDQNMLLCVEMCSLQSMKRSCDAMKKRSMKPSVKPHELLPSYAWTSRQNVMLLRQLITGHQLMSGKCNQFLVFISIFVLFQQYFYSLAYSL